MRTNEQIARQLQATARELSQKRSNLYRIRAYRQAANTILGLDRAVEDLLQEEGTRFLKRFPGIGTHLGETIAHYATTGEWKSFEELKASQPASGVA